MLQGSLRVVLILDDVGVIPLLLHHALEDGVDGSLVGCLTAQGLVELLDLGSEDFLGDRLVLQLMGYDVVLLLQCIAFPVSVLTISLKIEQALVLVVGLEGVLLLLAEALHLHKESVTICFQLRLHVSNGV